MWAVPRSVEAMKPPVQAGFSLLELVIVIILVIVLFLVAFNRLLPLRGEAEAAHVATVIGGLRSAIGLAAADRVVRDGLPALMELENSNPMRLLQEWPDRYIGAVDQPDPRGIPNGAWFFDRHTNTLGYRVRFPQYLEGEPDGPVDLNWRIEVLFDDLNGNGQLDPPVDRIHGLRLAPQHDQAWTRIASPTIMAH